LAMSNLSIVARKLVSLTFAPKYVTLNNAEIWDIGSITTVFSPMADFIKLHAMNTIMKFESPYRPSHWKTLDQLCTSCSLPPYHRNGLQHKWIEICLTQLLILDGAPSLRPRRRLIAEFSFSFEISRVKSLGSTNAHTNCSIQLSAIYPSITQFLYSIASSAFDLSTARVRALVRLSERADLSFIIIANRMALYYSVISWPGLSISSLLIPNHFSIVYPICLLPLLAYTHVVQSHPHLYFGMVKTCCSI
jgi:hypothetical protein